MCACFAAGVLTTCSGVTGGSWDVWSPETEGVWRNVGTGLLEGRGVGELYGGGGISCATGFPEIPEIRKSTSGNTFSSKLQSSYLG